VGSLEPTGFDGWEAGTLVWVQGQHGRHAGVVKGSHFKSVRLWVDVEIEVRDLADQIHATQVTVRPTQLRRRDQESDDAPAEPVGDTPTLF
jgi:hypothetical protein